ncbi:MAG: cobalamin B12-binding domain-containing protein, partial [Planctomycetes bacterium]|nr:cobalamin B12-binding domain-containing protein [Planctomycetota bacterium]
MIASASRGTRADIVFVNPPVTLAERYGKFKTAGSCLPQLGYAYLAATLRSRGIVPAIVDAPAEEIDDDEVIRRVRESGARVVGLTATTMSVCAAARVARRVKAELPGVITILGGTHMTAAPVETLERFTEFDFGAVGEADWTIVEVMEALLGGDGRALDRVVGLHLRRDGAIVDTGPRPGVQDMDALPMPAFDLMPDIATHYRPAPN